MKIIVDNYKTPSWNEVIKATARHWGGKKKIFDDCKEAMYWAIYQTKNKPELPFKKKVSLSFFIEYQGNRLHDIDSPSLKPIIDSLVDNGILVDDSVKWVNDLYIKVIIGTQDRVTIEIN